MRKALIILVGAGLLVFAAKAWLYFSASRAVESVLKAADEVVVCDFELSHLARIDRRIADAFPDGELFRISGHDNLASLKRMMDVSRSQQLLPINCRCGGRYTMIFKSQGQEIARIGYAHDSHLKRVPGFTTDLYLRPSAASDLTQWITKNTTGDVAAAKELAHKQPQAGRRD